ncbi:hypothetical protein D8674_035047 [Pyrus ussuriensis x Pyrus communis]|uniref:Uncharacterized protein n=1 Tax=Pyrus ussuriensis x Pyrus communis TaxID=2448454 RepID=A0A5N5GFY6_9ROSA|nr:hypothetical protein D8674_035047 [Pyrus ussuriensis x Pyrus communis]
MALAESDSDSDDPTDQIAKSKGKFSVNSCSINEWHQKCLEKKSTLVTLQRQLNERKYEELVQKDKEDVRHRSMYSWQTKQLQEECDSAFYDGFEKFHYIMASQMEDIIKDGGEYTEHKYVKVTHNTPTDA